MSADDTNPNSNPQSDSGYRRRRQGLPDQDSGIGRSFPLDPIPELVEQPTPQIGQDEELSQAIERLRTLIHLATEDVEDQAYIVHRNRRDPQAALELRQARVRLLELQTQLDQLLNTMQGSQMSQVPTYDGEPGQACLTWTKRVTKVQSMVGWDETQTLNLAEIKLDGAAARWLRQRELRDDYPTTWNDRPAVAGGAAGRKGLKSLIESRFGKTQTSGTAVEAVSDLKQKPDESVESFFDRVALAMDEKNHDEPEANKKTANYIRQYNRDVRTFLLAGIKPEYKMRVIGIQNPPTDLDEIVKILKDTEAELGSSKPSTLMALKSHHTEESEATVSQSTYAPQPNTSAPKPQSYTRPNTQQPKPAVYNKSNDICYRCNKRGHHSKECRSNPWTETSMNTNRGRGRGRYTPNRGRGRGRGRGYTRSYNQVDEESVQGSEQEFFDAESSENFQGGLWDAGAH